MQKAIQFSKNSKIHEPIWETMRLNHNSGSKAAQINLIVSGVEWSEIPDTIFNVMICTIVKTHQRVKIRRS